MRTEYEFFSPVKLIARKGAVLELAEIVKPFHSKKLLFITGKHVSKEPVFKEITQALEKAELQYEIYTDIVPEPPVAVVDRLADYIRMENFDIVCAIGGGSAMDIAKAVCMLKNNEGSIKEYLFGGSKTPIQPSLPLICIPTTAGSGSEMTAASVIEDTENSIKLSCTHPNLIPDIAILDPMVQVGMPPMITAGTGMDAMTHAIEAYTSKNASIISDIYAEKAIELIGKYLLKVMEEPENLDYRLMMAQASSIAAVAFLNGGLGAVHGISQSIGGIAHTPHGITNAILLPKVMKYNCKGDLDKFAKIAQLLGVDTSGMKKENAANAAVLKIEEINKKVGIPSTLESLKVTSDMFPEIVQGTMGYRLLWMNPIEMTEELAMTILQESL